MLSPEDNQRLAIIREKNARGEATPDDLREFVRIQREGRMAALNASDASRRKQAKAVVPNADDLLDEFLK